MSSMTVTRSPPAQPKTVPSTPVTFENPSHDLSDPKALILSSSSSSSSDSDSDSNRNSNCNSNSNKNGN